MDLLSPVTHYPGIGDKYAEKLAKLNIFTLYDLLTHLPSRYQDRSKLFKAAEVQPGEIVFLRGELSPIKNIVTKTSKFIQQATFTDASGSIPVIWFNQIYLVKNFKSPRQVYLYGKVDFSFNKKPSLISPEIEFDTGENLVGYIPIYPETAGVTSKWLRSKIKSLLPNLPTDLLTFNSPPWPQAISHIHFPPGLDISAEHTRLEIDELVVHTLSGLIAKETRLQNQTAPQLQIDQKKLRAFLDSLSFKLSTSQSQALQEILFDLSRTTPMNRLLEGDVGSGKTIVAAAAAYISYLNGYQSLFLVPTQILATQHHSTLTKLFPYLKIGLSTANTKTNGHITVGTHALLNQKIPKVGLVIIDEQHKFGVLQRSQLATTHTLTMTATPIPRSIALTLYGDLDLSVIERHHYNPIKTWLVPETKRAGAYQWIKDQVTQGAQAFIVCPFIDVSESADSVKSATAEFAKLQKIFPQQKLGLLHGRLKPTDKDQVMQDFKNRKLDILVCTPVVEVGIDIPNANIILIEDADRFGLAQLHQLRGRVGRGDIPSFCLLFSSKDTSRLETLTQTQSGLELAEADLRIRGPGQLFGTLQHGFIPFRVASFARPELILEAKKIAEQLFPQLSKHPFLKRLVEKVKIAGVYDATS